MNRWHLWALIALVWWTPLRAQCVDPATLADTTVGLIDPADTLPGSTFMADNHVTSPVDGSAWFLSSTELVTVQHVNVHLGLSMDSWKTIFLGQELGLRSARWKMSSVEIRIETMISTGDFENIYILSLSEPYQGAHIPNIRADIPETKEPVFGIGYTHGYLRYAKGHFLGIGKRSDGAFFAGEPAIEVTEGQDRLVLTHGASGGPVYDCPGRVVGIVSRVNSMMIGAQEVPLPGPTNGVILTTALARLVHK